MESKSFQGRKEMSWNPSPHLAWWSFDSCLPFCFCAIQIWRDAVGICWVVWHTYDCWDSDCRIERSSFSVAVSWVTRFWMSQGFGCVYYFFYKLCRSAYNPSINQKDPKRPWLVISWCRLLCSCSCITHLVICANTSGILQHLPKMCFDIWQRLEPVAQHEFLA